MGVEMGEVIREARLSEPPKGCALDTPGICYRLNWVMESQDGIWKGLGLECPEGEEGAVLWTRLQGYRQLLKLQGQRLGSFLTCWHLTCSHCGKTEKVDGGEEGEAVPNTQGQG